jgi:hypothetical protein
MTSAADDLCFISMHNTAYRAELNIASCHPSRKVQRGVWKSMMHVMRMMMQRKGTAGRQGKHDACDRVEMRQNLSYQLQWLQVWRQQLVMTW